MAKARLIELGISEPELSEVEATTRGRIEHAVESALAAPYPDPQAENATEFAP